MKKKHWPQVHYADHDFKMGLEDSDVAYTTIIPIIHSDDALGDPMSLNTNPEHASFAETKNSNCYMGSDISNMYMSLQCRLLQTAIADGVNDVKINYMPIVTSFGTELDEKDELSGLTVKTILELQTESTDRQTGPLFNNVKLQFSDVQGDDVPFLTTNQQLEGTAFNDIVFKQMMRYGTLAPLLRKITLGGKMKTMTLTKERRFAKHEFNFVPSAVKHIHKYSFYGLLIWLHQQTTSRDQYTESANTTDISHILGSLRFQYKEYHPDFHGGLV